MISLGLSAYFTTKKGYSATAYVGIGLHPEISVGKKKLLQKQAAGKKRMQAIGKVNVPSEAW
jgi:translation elongation factor EF-4